MDVDFVYQIEGCESMKRLKTLFFGTYARMLVSTYFLFALTGALLLMLPFSVQSGQSLSFVDAFFTTVSGMSTTGLSTINVAATLTPFGKIVLAMILQIGGIGIMMLLATYWLLIGKKIGFKQRSIIAAEQNQISLNGVIRLIRNILIVLISVQVISFIIMSLYLIVNYRQDFGVSGAIFQAFFLTISLVTNAGYDIDPGTSMFRYSSDYFMQFMGMALMFIGAVGFWPLSEFKDWVQAKRKKEIYRFSFISRILVKMHIGIWILSAVAFFFMEMNHFLSDKSIIDGTFYALFMTLSTRNSGFATMNVTLLTDATQMMFSALMFIGSSPNSAGGGIRTTTFLITIFAIYSFAIGREQVIINKKAIKEMAVLKSFVVVVGALFLVTIASILLMATQNHLVPAHPFLFKEAFFEVSSAFGTTGLSLGITDSINVIGKIILLIVMFIGRVGILTLLLILNTHQANNNIRYSETEIMVG